ncbi:hypothetical protein L6452_05889 [Arctium lappa]|uniref:Uncharacterized protein n=1 Tax=Arctium lappa TaxID=4217 RepID=A0ACB9EHB8_ARCLA|nr:hypothetical protein L6452_05889 [Arctium lappa]
MLLQIFSMDYGSIFSGRKDSPLVSRIDLLPSSLIAPPATVGLALLLPPIGLPAPSSILHSSDLPLLVEINP